MCVCVCVCAFHEYKAAACAPPCALPEGNGIECVLSSDGVADSRGASEDVTCYLAAPSIFLSARLRSQISRERVKDSGGREGVPECVHVWDGKCV